MEVTRIPGESLDRPGTLKCVYFKSRQKGNSREIVVLMNQQHGRNAKRPSPGSAVMTLIVQAVGIR